MKAVIYTKIGPPDVLQRKEVENLRPETMNLGPGSLFQNPQIE